ncbi:DUF2975 domain-containing protein [uncultured Gemmiger sp.]|uniref:DUF2975 domain-containing protein n=1 Tax=uncultured Gemmiger sp. TaxID=1623490 RepID=UPI0025D1F35A|nr:DUF2975 domain-containing protein [uncultured Gemmiger sp.]
MKALLNEKYARTAAAVLRVFCWLAICFFVLVTVLACLGRQQFTLRTSTDVYEGAIYAESDHDWGSRGFTVTSSDNLRVTANSDDGVDLSTHIGLSLMFAVQALPGAAGYWFLSRVFTRIAQGKIFIEPNARCLLGYGLLQIYVAFCLPFVKLLICNLTNLVSDSQISMSIQIGPDKLFPCIAFLVAAYIIHYGIALQDEVDHTL